MIRTQVSVMMVVASMIAGAGTVAAQPKSPFYSENGRLNLASVLAMGYVPGNIAVPTSWSDAASIVSRISGYYAEATRDPSGMAEDESDFRAGRSSTLRRWLEVYEQQARLSLREDRGNDLPAPVVPFQTASVAAPDELPAASCGVAVTPITGPATDTLDDFSMWVGRESNTALVFLPKALYSGIDDLADLELDFEDDPGASQTTEYEHYEVFNVSPLISRAISDATLSMSEASRLVAGVDRDGKPADVTRELATIGARYGYMGDASSEAELAGFVRTALSLLLIYRYQQCELSFNRGEIAMLGRYAVGFENGPTPIAFSPGRILPSAADFKAWQRVGSREELEIDGGIHVSRLADARGVGSVEVRYDGPRSLGTVGPSETEMLAALNLHPFVQSDLADRFFAARSKTRAAR